MHSPRPGRFLIGGTDVDKHTNDEGGPEVVEAPGFTVTDPQGRTRLFIGDLSGPGGDLWRPGIAIYDEDGSERVSLLLGDAGPVLSYATGGDTRLEVGVVDRHGEGTMPGPYLIALGRNGETAWSVRVDDEGLVRGS